jgi:hypothetical protein
VAGAAVGSGLGDGLCVAACDAGGLAEELSAGLTEVLAGLTEVLAVWLGEIVVLGVVLPAGENEDGGREGADPEQAETAAEASMVMVL